MSTQPWDVYAEQLFPLGYGHALWIPEPSSRNRREFFIGDVGWLKRGEFHVLFNSMKDKNHPINQGSDMPPDFASSAKASTDLADTSHIWNAYTGEALVIRLEHKRSVSSVAFSPDGRDVVSGSSDSTVKVSDSFTGDLLLSLVGHEQDSMINMVEFSPDGRYIISAGSDGKVRLWNSSDGTCQTVYNEHAANVFTVFASDASTFASSSEDGTVQIKPIMLAHRTD